MELSQDPEIKYLSSDVIANEAILPKKIIYNQHESLYCGEHFQNGELPVWFQGQIF